MEQIYLSRKNLVTLLSKLDRVKAGETSLCSLIKRDNTHEKFPQSMPEIMVTAIEDDEYYDRPAGEVYFKDSK